MPDFNFDETSPLDSSLVSQYPANERAHRTAVANWVDIEHHETGRHNLPAGDLSARDALADKELGIWFLGTDGSLLERYNGSGWDGLGLFRPGMMIPTAFLPSAEPRGWLECTGQAVSTTTFAALFAAIGATWDVQGGGSPGAGLFRVPDLQGRVPIGFDAGGDVDGDYTAMAGEWGSKTHVLVEAEIPAHTHPGTTDPGPPIGDVLAVTADGGITRFSPSNDNTFTIPFTTDPTGGGLKHENRQLSVVTGWLIKT